MGACNATMGMDLRKDTMILCSFSRLFQLLDKLLGVDEQLEIYDHLDQCEICRDTIYQLSRDRDEALFIYPGHSSKPYFDPLPPTQQKGPWMSTNDRCIVLIQYGSGSSRGHIRKG